MNLKKWLGKDVVLILKNGQEKTGTLKGPVIESDMIENEVRLLNGIFVTHIKIKDIVEIKDAFWYSFAWRFPLDSLHVKVFFASKKEVSLSHFF